MRNAFTILLFALCLTLTGCGDRLLERSYSSVVPHSAAYWENEDADTLRAENYQDLINALLLLLGEHSDDGVVRLYGDAMNKAAMASDACVEVQQETALGAYLLDYITYNGKAESGYYELTVRFGYRHTVEEQKAIINATSTEALPDLLRDAIEDGRDAIAIRFGYFGTDRNGVMALVSAVHDEVYPPEKEEAAEEEQPAPGETPPEEQSEEPAEGEAAETIATAELPVEGEPAEQPAEGEAPPEGELLPGDETPPEEPAEPVYDVSPWQVLFYPDNAQPGIVEVILNEKPNA